MAARIKKPEPQEKAERWLDRINKRKKDCETWWGEADKIYRRYRNESEVASTRTASATKSARRFNVLWSNIQVQKPALYGRDPKPVVERKHKDAAHVGRLASQILERALTVCVQDPSFGDAMKMARDDRLLASRGEVWLRYEPTYGEEKQTRIDVSLTPFKGYHDESGKRYEAESVVEDDIGPFVQGESYRPVVAEKVGIEFVHHKKFVHSDVPSWDKNYWCAREVDMTTRKIADRFGNVAAERIKVRREKIGDKNDKTPRDTAPIWEICDKDRGEWLWISPDYIEDGPLDEKPDPLNLSSFYPCPRPLYGTLTPDSLIPVCDWTEYVDQARELDALTDRAYRLIEAIRVAGVYDANVPGLNELFNRTTGDKFVAVNNWAAFAEKGGLKSAMDMIDIAPIAKALQTILEVRDIVKRDLYEISGISDIMRGDSDPRETLGAQKLKGSFGTNRMREPKDDMQRFVRDTIQIMAEIICEQFSPEQIGEMADVTDLLETMFKPNTDNPDPQAAQMEAQQQAMQAFQQAIQLLKDDGARGYKISIETDSTIELDEQQEKQDRIEFLTAATGYLQQAVAVVQVAPEYLTPLAESLLWGMRAFRVSRDVEQVWEEAIANSEKAQAERAKNPPPNPEMEKLKLAQQESQTKIQGQQDLSQIKLQTEQQKGQMEMGFMQAEHDAKMQMHQQTMQAAVQKHQVDTSIKQQQGSQQIALKQDAAENDMAMQQAQAESESQSDGGESGSMDKACEAMTKSAEALTKVAEVLAQALAPTKKAA